ncbi:hypothetical protein Bwad005_12320 [Bilophila wadsworthia]
MARPRKNATKAQGSLLKPDEVAEIPVEEQPYSLPEGWKWVRLLSVFSNHTDSKKKLPQKEYLSTGTFPVVDQGKEIVGGYTENQSLLYSGPLPVIIFGDHTRCIKSIDFFFVQGADGIKVLHAKDIIIHKFFYYALKNLNMPDLGYRRHFPLFKKFVLPLPPLDEQQRIVERTESLFAKLDEANAKAEAVLDGLETRKAAILHRAFTGELTHTPPISFLSITNFIKKEKNALKAGPFGSALKKDFYVPSGYKIYGQEQVIAGDETIGNYYINEEKYLELIACKVAPGDVLISLVGTVGKVLVLSENCEPGIINPRLIKITLDQSKIYPKFFSYYFQSDETKASYKESSHGTTMDVLNMSILKQLKFPCFSLPQQREITRILDSLLAKEQQVKEAAENVLEQIELMKKAILARAFRGKLTGPVT